MQILHKKDKKYFVAHLGYSSQKENKHEKNQQQKRWHNVKNTKVLHYSEEFF